MKTLTSLAAFCIALAGATTSPCPAQGVGLSEGDFLVDLELPTVDGERTIRLSSLRGKKLLLVQFASW